MQLFPLLNKTSLDNFSVNAGWMCLNSNVDVQDKKDYKFGTLKYMNGESILQIFQGWTVDYKKIMASTPLFRKHNILGCIAEDNTKYVYIPQISIAPFAAQRSFASVTYRSWNLTTFSVVDFIPDDLNYKMFNKVLLSFTFLDDWINPALRFETEGMSTKVKSASSRNLAYFTYHGQIFKVSIEGNVKKQEGQNDRYIKYQNKSWLVIEGENNISSAEAIMFATEMKKIFSVVLARSVNTIQLSKKGIDKKSHRNITEDLYFLENRFSENQMSLFIYEMFQESKDIQLNILIPNWFNKGENFELLVSDYLLTINYQETVENKLINLTEGIESYYRDQNKSLCEKIQLMLHSLPENLQNVLKEKVGPLDNWAKTLKQNRVYIVHGNKKKFVIDNIEELSEHVNLLQYLVQYFILQQLGMKIRNTNIVKTNINGFFSSERI